MYSLHWAFDVQVCKEQSLVGSYESVMEMYGVLWAQKEELSYIFVRDVKTGSEYRRFIKKESGGI